jgi:hypothetical protein
MAYVKAIPHYMKRKTQTKLGFSPIVQNIKNLLHAHSLLPTGCFQYSVLVDFSSLVSMHLHSSHEPIQDLEYWFSFHKVFFASKLCTVHWNLLCMGRRDLSIFYPSWHPSTCIIISHTIQVLNTSRSQAYGELQTQKKLFANASCMIA